MKIPTSSQISAPSELPIVTSNKLLLLFSIYSFPWLKWSDFLACLIIEMSSSEMSAKLEAQDIAWSSKFSEIDA